MEDCVFKRVDRRTRAEIDQLCDDFDPELLIPDWFRRTTGDPGDWACFLRVQRRSLRSQVEVAAILGGVLDHIGDLWTEAGGYPWANEEEVRLQLLYGLAQELTTGGDREDLFGMFRVYEALGEQDGHTLSDIMSEACDVACNRALRLTTTATSIASE